MIVTPTLSFVVPANIIDATVPSGGNKYDRMVTEGLTALGWRVTHVPVTDTDTLATELAALPDGALVLMDGLVACNAPDVVVRVAGRLRIAVLVHMPLTREYGLPPQVATDLDTRERAVLHAAAAVIATSRWSARWIADHHDLGTVHVATPGTTRMPIATGTDGASRLLCVAAVTPGKGLDLLVDALTMIADRAWTCDVIGSLHRDPSCVDRIRRTIERNGLGDRIRLAGPSTRLADEYARTDLCVLTSRSETYGMVVAESLAHGIPVLATAVDAIPETLGTAPDGTVPGMLVEQDAEQIATALRGWFDDAALRERLRAAAIARRDELDDWSSTARAVADVLERQRVAA